MSFRPSWLATMALASLAALFCWLGNWQWQRAIFKQGLVDRFEAAPAFLSLAPPGQARPYTRVALDGAFDGLRSVLVDNRFLGSRPGVHVLTPFRATDGTLLLVNRGWLPMPPDRRKLPTVNPRTELTRIAGMLDELRIPGRQLGEADELVTDRWPQLVTYPDLAAIGEALGEEPYPLVLLLDPESPGGFEGRDWQPVHVPPHRHRGYAFQWYALAAAAFGAWIFLGVRRARLGCMEQ